MHTRISKNLIWNYLSIAFIAVSSLMMNAVIAYKYDETVLGIFNEAYAWYMILSQVAVLGINMAVLKYVPEQIENDQKDDYLLSAVFSVVIVSFVVVVISETLLGLFCRFEWKKAAQIAMAGLILFSVNKVLLNYLNARYEFVSHALFQSLRMLSMIMVVCYLSYERVDGDMLTLTFPLSETITCFGMIIYIFVKLHFNGRISFSICEQVIKFGIKIFPSSMVVQMNTKLDVVCLSFLMQDTAKIGVYSFAIQFAEGFFELYLIIRKLVNPGISKAASERHTKEYFEHLDRKVRKYNPIASAVALIGIAGVYYIVCFIMRKQLYYVGVLYLLIVCISIAINSRAVIWGDILGQTGYPIDESKGNVVTALTNIILNILLISCFGAYGAAFATAISHFVYSIIQKNLVRKRLGIIM